MKLRHLFTIAAAGAFISSGAAIAQEQGAPTAGASHTSDASTATYGPSTYRGADYGGSTYGATNAGARNYGEWVRGQNPANCPAGLACNVYKGS
ncbi:MULTISPECIES: hypothetical protein [unclassified Caballeronia]|uniref:hypothetical protein n=1 Tax=unclassified Caballeronia TaxID=2646786 RepID=UPI002863C29E|nr:MULTISPECIES: hypothetical protein [unclassified Caballeronia]MDR5740524.1 hypothetical protein [Caballeronia sp. LZ016]MDR5808956.1 hypothetical protein [Caballeronia sp. LZ019]